jgi:cytochrome c oxidase cbb3-type subunit 4
MRDTLLGLWTLAAFIVFLGIVAWAWSRKRSKDFDEAARLPLEDDREDDLEDGLNGDNSSTMTDNRKREKTNG